MQIKTKQFLNQEVYSRKTINVMGFFVTENKFWFNKIELSLKMIVLMIYWINLKQLLSQLCLLQLYKIIFRIKLINTKVPSAEKKLKDIEIIDVTTRHKCHYKLKIIYLWQQIIRYFIFYWGTILHLDDIRLYVIS